MKFLKFLLIIFISINSSVNADSKKKIIKELKKGGKIIFIRHAYAPGGGDPKNFNIKECSTQRNLNKEGRDYSKKIGSFFEYNKIMINKVYSSEWCRCKETALIAFKEYKTKNFLNSFFSPQFAKNKDIQINNLKKFVENWEGNQNIVFVTHYVVIYEILDYSPSSGEMIITNKKFKVIGKVSEFE